MSLASICRARGALRQLQLLRQAATFMAALHAGSGSGSSSGGSAAAQLLGAPASQLWRYDSPLLRHLSTSADSEVGGAWFTRRRRTD